VDGAAGLAYASVSAKPGRPAAAKMPRFTGTSAAKSYLEKEENPWTPAVSVVFATQTALDMMLKEGIKNIFARHVKIGKMTRDGVKSLGLPLFAEESHASNTVTSVTIPEGMDGKKFRQLMSSEHGIVLSGGQLKLDGKIFRTATWTGE
jgi:aspartate aminotransferase-like enzyme